VAEPLQETEAPADRERTTHATTQTVGLGLIAASFIALVIVSLLVLDGDDAGLFVGISVLAAAITAITWFFDTQWARVVGLVGTVLALGIFFLAFGLFQVFSPIEFTVAVAYTLGWFLSLVGGIRAILAGRRHQSGPTPTEARLPVIAAAIVGVAALVSVTGFLFTKETVDPSEAAGATEVDMTKFEFDPDVSTLPVEGKLLIKNTDPFAHDFTLDALDLSVPVGPGSETLVDLSGLAPGTYPYHCSLHSDGTTGMTGTIVIEG
jgi:plastocyanin